MTWSQEVRARCLVVVPEVDPWTGVGLYEVQRASKSDRARSLRGSGVVVQGDVYVYTTPTKVVGCRGGGGVGTGRGKG